MGPPIFTISHVLLLCVPSLPNFSTCVFLLESCHQVLTPPTPPTTESQNDWEFTYPWGSFQPMTEGSGTSASAVFDPDGNSAELWLRVYPELLAGLGQTYLPWDITWCHILLWYYLLFAVPLPHTTSIFSREHILINHFLISESVSEEPKCSDYLLLCKKPPQT